MSNSAVWLFCLGLTLAAASGFAQSTENGAQSTNSADRRKVVQAQVMKERTNSHAVAASAATNAAALHSAAATATDPEEQKVLASRAKKADQEAADAAAKAGATQESGRFKVFMSTGAKLENPYTIQPDGSVKAGNSTTDGTIDINLNARYIFAMGPLEDLLLFANAVPTNTANGLFSPLTYFPDLDLHFGFTFGGQSTPSNVVGSTIPGGADLYSDNAIGLPFYRFKGEDFKLQSTIELAGGFVTDKKFISLHPNAFVGLGLQLQSGSFYWSSRLGIGMVEEPKFDSSNPSLVARDSLQNPEFKSAFAVAWGNALSYKISDKVYAQVAANVYFTQLPTWNITVGLTLDPGKILGKLNQ